MPERTTAVGVSVRAIVYDADGNPIYTDMRLRWDDPGDDGQQLDLRFDCEIPDEPIVNVAAADLRRALDMLDSLPDELAQGSS